MAEGAAASAGAASLGVSSSAETSVSRHRSNQNIFVPQQQPPRQLLPAAADPALNPRRTVPHDVATWALECEYAYFENMKMLVDHFVQPLRRWGLIKTEDLQDMFSNIDDLYRYSLHFSPGLSQASSGVPSDEVISTIASIFNPSLLELYSIYCKNYPLAERVVARNLQKHDRFSAFLNVQQRNTGTTLEYLLRCPVERAMAYHDVLRRIIALTPLDHACKTDLDAALADWETLLHELEQARSQRENEEKLAAIELSFPSEHLNLLQRGDDTTDESFPTPRGKGRRRLSAPSSLFKFALNAQEAIKNQRTGSRVGKGLTRQDTDDEEREREREEAPSRWFIREGPVMVTKEGDQRKRYLFLFSDQLLIAKLRPPRTYSLKLRFRLRNCWLHPHSPDRITEGDNLSFVVGMPQERDLVFTCASTAEKQAWTEDIARQIANTKASGPSSDGHINVCIMATDKGGALNATSSDTPRIETLSIDTTNSSSDVLRIALEQLGWKDMDPQDFILWELTNLSLQPLQGWECPMAIVNVGVRTEIHDPRCHFILSPRGVLLTIDMLPGFLRNVVKSLSPRTNKRLVGRSATANKRESKSKEKSRRSTNFLRKMQSIGKGKAQSQTAGAEADAASPSGELYGLPLSELVQDGVLPEPIRDMISRLYYDGPSAAGLFRKSANARIIKEVHARLDAGLPVDIGEVPILAVGSIFKEFLRSLPDSLFPLELYGHFIATNDIADESERLKCVKVVMERLPSTNVALLKAIVPVLVEISKNHEANNMTLANVSICVGQSMMWPANVEDVLKNDVPPFIEFVLEHAEEIFGEMEAPPPLEMVTRPTATPDSGASGTGNVFKAGLDRRDSGASIGTTDEGEFDESYILSPSTSPTPGQDSTDTGDWTTGNDTSPPRQFSTSSATSPLGAGRASAGSPSKSASSSPRPTRWSAGGHGSVSPSTFAPSMREPRRSPVLLRAHYAMAMENSHAAGAAGNSGRGSAPRPRHYSAGPSLGAHSQPHHYQQQQHQQHQQPKVVVAPPSPQMSDRASSPARGGGSRSSGRNSPRHGSPGPPGASSGAGGGGSSNGGSNGSSSSDGPTAVLSRANLQAHENMHRLAAPGVGGAVLSPRSSPGTSPQMPRSRGASTSASAAAGGGGAGGGVALRAQQAAPREVSAVMPVAPPRHRRTRQDSSGSTGARSTSSDQPPAETGDDSGAAGPASSTSHPKPSNSSSSPVRSGGRSPLARRAAGHTGGAPSSPLARGMDTSSPPPAPPTGSGSARGSGSAAASGTVVSPSTSSLLHSKRAGRRRSILMATTGSATSLGGGSSATGGYSSGGSSYGGDMSPLTMSGRGSPISPGSPASPKGTPPPPSYDQLHIHGAVTMRPAVSDDELDDDEFVSDEEMAGAPQNGHDSRHDSPSALAPPPAGAAAAGGEGGVVRRQLVASPINVVNRRSCPTTATEFEDLETTIV